MIEIKHKIDGSVLFKADVGSLKLALEAAVRSGSDLRGSDLRYSNLSGSDLRCIKNYVNSHDIFFEAVRRQNKKALTDKQWTIIGKISIHRWCWDTLKKEFGNELTPVFQILANSGFNEYLNHYKSIKKEN